MRQACLRHSTMARLMSERLHLKVVNELANVDCIMESENRAQLQKGLLEEINEIKKTLQTRDALCFSYSFLFVMSCVTKMDKLQDIYYQPNHFWKGQSAVRELRELSKEKPSVIKQWLSRQAIWQVHLPPLKHVNRPHYQVMIPNQMHQFDLLYMPSNTLYENNCKYILS